MNRRSFRTLLLLAVACVLLPSCVEWRIGENIRELAETHSYLQLSEAEGGLVYTSRLPLPAGAEECESPVCLNNPPKGSCYYARLPVIEAKQSSSPVVWHIPYGDGVQRTIRGRRHTGEMRLVVRKGKKLYLLPVDARLPQDAAGRPMQLCDHGQISMISTRRGFWYGAACVLASPFDYVIDPVLMVVTTPIVDVGATAIGYLYYTVESLFRRNATEPQADPETATRQAS